MGRIGTDYVASVSRVSGRQVMMTAGQQQSLRLNHHGYSMLYFHGSRIVVRGDLWICHADGIIFFCPVMLYGPNAHSVLFFFFVDYHAEYLKRLQILMRPRFIGCNFNFSSSALAWLRSIGGLTLTVDC